MQIAALTILERVVPTRVKRLSDRMLCAQVARGQQLLLASAPVIPTLRVFELSHSLVARASEVVVRYDLVERKQLPIFGLTPKEAKQRVKELALVDLQAIRASIIERQEQFDDLAAEVRQIGSEVVARLTTGQQQLLLQLEKFAGARVEFVLPDGELQLHIPSIGELKQVEEPGKLRASIAWFARDQAVLAGPSIRDAAGQWVPVVNLRRGKLRLRWDSAASKQQLLTIAEAAVMERTLEMTVRLTRVGTAQQPSEATLVDVQLRPLA